MFDSEFRDTVDMRRYEIYVCEKPEVVIMDTKSLYEVET